MMKMVRGYAAGALIAALALAPIGCAVNPATGHSQLMLISEEQEKAMGAEADAEMVATQGLYGDPEIQEYINALGQDLASQSERPDLEWHFRVLDDPIVNAFALPGGYVYITRGILSHLNTESELAAVLGHEIGHVVARHSANQMSKQTLVGIGVMVGTILLDPEDRIYGVLAGIGSQLLMLQFSRDDEREADMLGLRYIDRLGYDPRPMSEVFETLGRVAQAQGGGDMPKWLSTHPAPEDRVERVQAGIAALHISDFSGRKVGGDAYLSHIDGIVYGPDPRNEGFVQDDVFYHPALGLQLRLPAGWTYQNTRQAFVAVSPQEEAFLLLTPSEGGSPQEAEEKFFAQSGVVAGQQWQPSLGGMKAVGRGFEVNDEDGAQQGRVAFVSYGDQVFQLMALSSKRRWNSYEHEVEESVESFSKVTDPKVLAVQPRRGDMVTLKQPVNLEQFNRFFPSTVDLETLAILNHVQVDTVMPAGTRVKRVVGGELPETKGAKGQKKK